MHCNLLLVETLCHQKHHILNKAVVDILDLITNADIFNALSDNNVVQSIKDFCGLDGDCKYVMPEQLSLELDDNLRDALDVHFKIPGEYEKFKSTLKDKLTTLYEGQPSANITAKMQLIINELSNEFYFGNDLNKMLDISILVELYYKNACTGSPSPRACAIENAVNILIPAKDKDPNAFTGSLKDLLGKDIGDNNSFADMLIEDNGQAIQMLHKEHHGIKKIAERYNANNKDNSTNAKNKFYCTIFDEGLTHFDGNDLRINGCTLDQGDKLVFAPDHVTAPNIKVMLQNHALKELISSTYARGLLKDTTVKILMKDDHEILADFVEKYKESRRYNGPDLYYDAINIDTKDLFEQLKPDHVTVLNVKYLLQESSFKNLIQHTQSRDLLKDDDAAKIIKGVSLKTSLAGGKNCIAIIWMQIPWAC